MRPTTITHAGIRNIGDSEDAGQFMEGQLSHVLMWIVESLGKLTLARRVTICLARTREEVEVGLTLKKGRNAPSNEMKSILDGLIANMGMDSEDESSMLSGAMPDRDPEDTYIA